MIDILICDDDKYFCGHIEKAIMDWEARSQHKVNVEQCYSGKALRQFMDIGVRPDLLFLDIELGDDTGTRIGEYVREYLKDEKLQIVFVSSCSQYAMDLFSIRPFDFLIKPVSMETLGNVLDKYCEVKLCDEKRYFVYQQKKHAHRIKLSDIMYLQSDRKKIKIFTNGPLHNMLISDKEGMREDRIEYYGELDGAMQQLDQELFWYIHKSYIVNVSYVKTFGRNVFTLLNGVEIPVSRSRWKEVQQWILKNENL